MNDTGRTDTGTTNTPDAGDGTTLNDRAVSPGLKFALELGPTILFVLAYSQGERLIGLFGLPEPLSRPLFLATAVLMTALVAALAVSWTLTRTLPVMPVVTAAVVLVFGGLTLYLQDEWFAYVKPTIVNCLFGSVLLVGLLFGRSLMKMLLETSIAMDDEGWRKLTLRWGVFFFFLALVNEVVWRNFSEPFWAGFKLWGFVPLTLAFTLAQLPLMQRHAIEKE